MHQVPTDGRGYLLHEDALDREHPLLTESPVRPHFEAHQLNLADDDLFHLIFAHPYFADDGLPHLILARSHLEAYRPYLADGCPSHPIDVQAFPTVVEATVIVFAMKKKGEGQGQKNGS